MAETDFRAKFVALYKENETVLDRRQMPMIVDETLTVVVQFNNSRDSPGSICLKQKDISNFSKKYDLFTQTELMLLLKVNENMLNNLMAMVVPCVGCRRSIERFYNEVMEFSHPALDPLNIDEKGTITISNDYMCSPELMCGLFNLYGSKLNSFIDTIPKTKKNRRCLLHSLDSHKVRPAGNWLDVWEQMSLDCQQQVVIIERDVLFDNLETNLRKHRFCSECKSKVLQAFNLLVNEADPSKEKDFLPSLYRGIDYCKEQNHIHVECNTDFVANLMSRAEPELRGSRREKHAKTIDVAQEEVLVCIGICLYERLHRINQRMREEEQTWQIMFYLGVECLKTKFEMTVDKKLGISQLELLCKEIQLAEIAKEQKREHKRQKRKEKKNRLRIEAESNECRNGSTCLCKEKLAQVDQCKLCLEHRSCSGSRASSPEDNDSGFLTLSPDGSDNSNPSTPPMVSPVITPKLSTCSCSSSMQTINKLLSYKSATGDRRYLSESSKSLPWPTSSNPCDICLDGTFAESCDCCCDTEKFNNCELTKSSGCLCEAPIKYKCDDCIQISSVEEEIINEAVPYDQSPSMKLLLKVFSPSEDDVIPYEELQIMRVKVRQNSQERIKFRENLRRRFQDLQKLTKFRFRPFVFYKLSNHYIGHHD